MFPPNRLLLFSGKRYDGIMMMMRKRTLSTALSNSRRNKNQYSHCLVSSNNATLLYNSNISIARNDGIGGTKVAVNNSNERRCLSSSTTTTGPDTATTDTTLDEKDKKKDGIPHFGRLWGRGYEIFYEPGHSSDTDTTKIARRIIQIRGEGATTYLQNLVTSDLTEATPVPPKPEPAEALLPGVPIEEQLQKEHGQHPIPKITFNPQLRSTCFLDHKGRIITDSLLWKISDTEYYIDVPSTAATMLLDHLQKYKLRKSKVSIADVTTKMSSGVVYGTLVSEGGPPGFYIGLDPRHPSLGMRLLKKLPPTDNNSANTEVGPMKISDLFDNTVYPEMTMNYEFIRRVVGVAEGVELMNRIALEANQEFLNAISFHKGCYLGQELTARVHHTGIVRKRIMPLYLIDRVTEVPKAWGMASQIQEDRFNKTYTYDELQRLPTRLPRLSVFTAGTQVGVMTAAFISDHQKQLEQQKPQGDDGEGEMDDETREKNEEEKRKLQEASTHLLRDIKASCTMGSKIVDSVTGKTIGQIVTPPIDGCNVVLALMRLETVGLLQGGVWSRTNRIHITQPEQRDDSSADDGEKDDSHDQSSSTETTETTNNEFRYLPYVPLWWPEIDMETGKEKVDPTIPNLSEVREEIADDTTKTKGSKEGYSHIILEEINPTDKETGKENVDPTIPNLLEVREETADDDDTTKTKEPKESYTQIMTEEIDPDESKK